MENRFLHLRLVTNTQEAFVVKEIKTYAWNPIISNGLLKTDIVNKHSKACNIKE
jgi:hypothetical protein